MVQVAALVEAPPQRTGPGELCQPRDDATTNVYATVGTDSQRQVPGRRTEQRKKEFQGLMTQRIFHRRTQATDLYQPCASDLEVLV